MIKGIYNENEFYNNFYWDNKLQDEVKSKASAFALLSDEANSLKELDQLFWNMQDASKSGIKSQDALVNFYQKVFHALGYQFISEKRDTQQGMQYTLFLNEELKNSPELFGILIDAKETGLFESSPLALTPTDELPAEDRDLSDILQEELLESEKPPKWVLVGSHNALFVIERNKWSFGRFIKIEWQEIFLQRDIKPYELIWGLASKAMLCPETGSSAHLEFDDNSHRHAFEVTTELRESVRESIELLINEMIHAKKEAHEKYLRKEDEANFYAKELTHDALFYVYRLIFLLYLEAQGEDSDLLPLKSEVYRMGYSLEKLLELDFVTIMPNTPDYDGTFLQESLDKIFSLIYNGFNPDVKADILRDTYSGTGFLVKGIKSDLFNPDITKHLKGIKLRNGVLQQVLIKLSLTRIQSKGKKQRARVSYANLGINQLGAVYEGLLSYSGFFAQEELHALKPTSVKQSDIDNGKELDQVYLAPKSLVEKYRTTKEKKYKLTEENVVLDESGNPKIYKKGSFIYRLAGRDRQKLASFYTPESLTKCTVKYSLKVLFENKKTLKDLWNVKILEPAMGSGAFLNEAVNQIADRILELEVKESVGELKTPKDKQKRLWEIKYQLISQNVYGVDLNPTAIELARFSLWLNCIGAGKEPPQFTGRLKVGNSLIGARFKKGADGIYPWLLLDDGMMNYGKRLKDYDADQYDKLQAFRKDLISSKLESSHDKIKVLQLKAEGVLKELITSKDIDKKHAAYERLKLCGDLWCSAFFLSDNNLKNYPAKHEALCDVFASILENGSIDTKLKSIIEEKYNSERFFHWEIEFPEIISSGGFDLILGNPPWLAIEWQDSMFVSDENPIPIVLEFNAAQTRTFVDELENQQVYQLLLKEFIKLEGYSNLLETPFYGKLSGVQKNTYKAFDVLALSLLRTNAVFGVIQEDGILEDRKSSHFREELYQKFRYHFQFQNEKKLFAEVGNPKRYSLNIFENKTTNEVSFEHIGNLYLSATIDACYSDLLGTESIPLIKNENDQWETRGHKKRVVSIASDTVSLFKKFLNDEETNAPVFLNLHSQPLLGVLGKIAASSKTIQSYLGKENCIGSAMFDESGAQDSNYIEPKSKYSKSIAEAVLSGPHINTANPLSQETQESYKTKFSYDKIDLNNVDDNFYPRTLYQLKISSKEADTLFPLLKDKPYRSYFRLVTRGMVNATNERCLFTVILPPQMSHINGIKGIATITSSKIPIVAGVAVSLIQDGILRIKNKSNMFPDDIFNMPLGNNDKYLNSVGRRALALNGLTSYYSELWESCADLALTNKEYDKVGEKFSLEGQGKVYNKKYTLRAEELREQALIEIDALTALSFGMTSEELVQVYEILFPVLNMYDRKRVFNRKAKLIEAHKFFQERGW